MSIGGHLVDRRSHGPGATLHSASALPEGRLVATQHPVEESQGIASGDVSVIAVLDELDARPELLEELKAVLLAGNGFTLVVLPGDWDQVRVAAQAPVLLADFAPVGANVNVLTGPLAEVDHQRLARLCAGVYGGARLPQPLERLERIAPGELAGWWSRARDAQPSAAPGIPSGFGVNVIGHISGAAGLGVAARATIGALLSAEVPVAVVDIKLGADRAGRDQTYAHLHAKNVDELPYPVTLVHMNPVEAAPLWNTVPHWFNRHYTCIVPFWELSDIQERWIEPLSRYDAVLAPTQHISAAIRREVAVPVRSFPLAAELPEVTPVDRAEFGIAPDQVVFAASWDGGSGVNRKNGVGVLRAFETALELGADATLLLKLYDAPDPSLESQLARLPRGRVITVVDYLPYPRLLGLYQACDAYISLHRAEGLGLGMMEAMLLGKPVIATGWSGNMDFMDDGCAALVGYRLTPVVDPSPEYEPGRFARPQLWADPDLLTAARHIKRLAADVDLRSRLGQAGRARAVAYRADWLRTAGSRLVQLNALYGNPRPLSEAAGGRARS